eukprot:TRINITY_DN5924_c1_g2_i1.p1 TRINITY_DN5924_c1_g2~~TRINITY_DN5924_c1_g2_i1.p1  ORF type:complete len:111 (-),score=16.24 TRINITY_DN5924_c1_g2_i1:364-696(-)
MKGCTVQERETECERRRKKAINKKKHRNGPLESSSHIREGQLAPILHNKVKRDIPKERKDRHPRSNGKLEPIHKRLQKRLIVLKAFCVHFLPDGLQNCQERRPPQCPSFL